MWPRASGPTSLSPSLCVNGAKGQSEGSKIGLATWNKPLSKDVVLSFPEPHKGHAASEVEALCLQYPSASQVPEGSVPHGAVCARPLGEVRNRPILSANVISFSLGLWSSLLASGPVLPALPARPALGLVSWQVLAQPRTSLEVCGMREGGQCPSCQSSAGGKAEATRRAPGLTRSPATCSALPGPGG